MYTTKLKNTQALTAGSPARLTTTGQQIPGEALPSSVYTGQQVQYISLKKSIYKFNTELYQKEKKVLHYVDLVIFRGIQDEIHTGHGLFSLCFFVPIIIKLMPTHTTVT